MQEIKKIQSTSLAKIIAMLYGIISFFFSISLGMLIMINIIPGSNIEGSIIFVILLYIGIGILLGVINALLASFLGYIFGYAIAFLYNILAMRIGGIKFESKNVNIK